MRIIAQKKQGPSRNAGRAKETSVISVPLKRHRDKNNGHYHIIVDSVEDQYVSVGTSSKATKGKHSKSPNYRCEADILGSGQPTYLRRQGTVDKKTNYFGSRQGPMTVKDYERVRIYGERAKQKYLAKKKK